MTARKSNNTVPKFLSFQVAYWTSERSSSYSLYALGEDGRIYRWLAGASQWEVLA